jgi:uncharacterized protein YndB with AHSA1/START domain
MRQREKLFEIAGPVLAIALLAAPAQGSVDDVGATGFAITETANIAAPPDRVYAVMIEPSRWWSSNHTYSHDAANLTLDAKAGGCWCETVPGGGSVQHLVVVSAMPGSVLRLRGALGPLQAMAVDGAMTLGVRAANGGTHFTMTYAVGGYSKDGFAKLAEAVDAVLGEQTARLQHYLENGSPDALPQQKTKGLSP